MSLSQALGSSGTGGAHSQMSRRGFLPHRLFSAPGHRDGGPSVPNRRSPPGIPERVSAGPESASSPPASPVVPPIEIEPPSLLPPNREFHPIREVVLPASAVLAWSLFGLIGIATSFLAGLMVGHYFWRM